MMVPRTQGKSQLFGCHSHACHIILHRPFLAIKKTKKDKKCKNLSFYRCLPKSYWLCCWDKYIWFYCWPVGHCIWIGRMLSYSFLFEILLWCLDILHKRELKKGLKEDQWLSGKIIISSSRHHIAYWKAISEVPSTGNTVPLSSPPIPFQLVSDPQKTTYLFRFLKILYRQQSVRRAVRWRHSWWAFWFICRALFSSEIPQSASLTWRLCLQLKCGPLQGETSTVHNSF